MKVTADVDALFQNQSITEQVQTRLVNLLAAATTQAFCKSLDGLALVTWRSVMKDSFSLSQTDCHQSRRR
jgi:hypothetical protein